MSRTISTGRLVRRVVLGPLVATALLATAACGNSSVPVEAPTVPATETPLSAPSANTATTATPTASSEPSASVPASTPSSTSIPVGPDTTGTTTPVATVPSASTPAAPSGMQGDPGATLKVGETAHLDNWDITVQRAQFGYEGFSYGWKVNVCYVDASDLAVDGRIKVSDKAWTALVQDLEGVDENAVESVPIPNFERDHTWTPEYVNTTLALGECNLGWIGVMNDNPDLGYAGIVYSPSTGETITWKS